MRDEIAQMLKKRVATLYENRHSRLGGHVLFVSGDSSTIDGRPFLEELRRRVLTSPAGDDLSEEEVKNMSLGDRIARFDSTWEDGDDNTKDTWMQNLRNRLKPTKGHADLAELLKANYFPLVLTTALDRLIETKFIATTGESPSIFVNGRDSQDEIIDALHKLTPGKSGTIFLKLLGEFPSKYTYAITQDAVREKISSISKVLDELKQYSLVTVGLNTLDELCIQQFPVSGGTRIMFIGVDVDTALTKKRFDAASSKWGRRTDYIADDGLGFDNVFQVITARLPDWPRATPTDALHPNVAPAPHNVAPPNAAPQNAVYESAATRPAPRSGGPVVRLLNADAPPPPVPEAPPTPFVLLKTLVFTFKVEDDRKMSVEVRGSGKNFVSETPYEWPLDLAKLNRDLHDMGRELYLHHRQHDVDGGARWRVRAKDKGMQLYNELVRGYPNHEWENLLNQARELKASDPENLTLLFKGPRGYLGMPYELLHDGHSPLVCDYPLCRVVSDVPRTRHKEPFNTFFDTLRRTKKPLKVLLIAYNGSGLTADQEIVEVQHLISQRAAQIDLLVEFTRLPGEVASLQKVKEQLEKRPLEKRPAYHIIHYAGDAVVDEAHGEESGLRLWQQNGRTKDPVRLNTRELYALLNGSETRLLYLSCCVGGWTGDASLLHDNDYLGIMDAAVQAGVPYVFGYRWYITDTASRLFARSFYEDLFNKPSIPEQAVWRARQRVYGKDGNDETWASPIFVAQTPYQHPHS